MQGGFVCVCVCVFVGDVELGGRGGVDDFDEVII